MQTVDSSRGMSLPSAEFFHEETVNTDLRLGDFATTPLYNIKAVVQATNISPSTLRAWERRYHMCRPQRSESGYRLYSERDVAIIRWLKTQVDAGMAISQAVAWLESCREAENQDDAVLPGAATGAASTDRAGVQGVPSQPQVRHFVALQEDLLAACSSWMNTRQKWCSRKRFDVHVRGDRRKADPARAGRDRRALKATAI